MLILRKLPAAVYILFWKYLTEWIGKIHILKPFVFSIMLRSVPIVVLYITVPKMTHDTYGNLLG